VSSRGEWRGCSGGAEGWKTNELGEDVHERMGTVGGDVVKVLQVCDRRHCQPGQPTSHTLAM
jgi:hypothetical protein